MSIITIALMIFGAFVWALLELARQEKALAEVASLLIPKKTPTRSGE